MAEIGSVSRKVLRTWKPWTEIPLLGGNTIEVDPAIPIEIDLAGKQTHVELRSHFGTVDIPIAHGPLKRRVLKLALNETGDLAWMPPER